MLSKPTKTNPYLTELLEHAKNHVMSKGERDAQRKSWVKGEMMLQYPTMTDAEFEKIWQRADH